PGTLAGRLLRVDALVVVVDGDGEDLLRPLLADHVVVEERLDLHRGGERDRGPVLFPLALLGDDVVAELDALVADVDGRTGDELADFPLPLPAKRAREIAVVMAVLPAHVTSCPRSLRKGLPAGQPCPPTVRREIYRGWVPRARIRSPRTRICCLGTMLPLAPLASRPDRAPRRCARARAGRLAKRLPRAGFPSAAASFSAAAPALGEGGSILPRAQQLPGKEISLRFPLLRADGARLGPGARGAAGTRWAVRSLRAVIAIERPQARPAAHILGTAGRGSAGSERKGIPQTPSTEPGRTPRGGRSGAGDARVV